MLFERPVRRITAFSPEDVPSVLEQVDLERGRGRHVCGYMAYEAGELGSRRARVARKAGSAPLADFYSFDEGVSMTSTAVAEWLARECRGALTPTVHGVSWTETRETYRAKVAAIRDHIERGDTYQVNFTFKCAFELEGSGLALYRRLRARQPVEHGAYVRLGDQEILSFSPELFVRRRGALVTLKPMKGTAPRGKSKAEDEEIAASLKADPKTLSENVMIVDLIRSDLGRVATIGSVYVEDLFDVETFETLHQMVSKVHGTVADDTTLLDVMTAVFPCGSVTGAPKRRTMEIIDALETAPRGIYTGALGRVEPGGDFSFSVPIRTLVVRGRHGEMGVGSGIVYESDPEAELDECFLKARFLTRSNEGLRLIETLRYDGALRDLVDVDAHLRRLEGSAAVFDFVFDRTRILGSVRGALDNVASIPGSRGVPGEKGRARGDSKVRVLLSIDGDVEVSVEPIAPLETPFGSKPCVLLSPEAIDSASCFRRHKTTARALYDAEYAACVAAGGYDVLFLNERGELAEASRHNVFIERGGVLLTPPVDAGALPGIERQRILANPRFKASVATLSMVDLATADRIWLSNAVRGLVEVVLAPEVAAIRQPVMAASACST